MPKCIVCGEPFFGESYDPPEPEEHCHCGQDATGSLWEWNRLTAYLDWFAFRVANAFMLLGSKLWEWRFG